MGENLAWNQSDNPFKGWYDREKPIYEQTREWSGSTGHYLNILTAGYGVTGASSCYGGSPYGNAQGQTFGFSGYTASDGMELSVFGALLDEYRAIVSGD